MKYQTHSTSVAIALVISFSVMAEKRARKIVCTYVHTYHCEDTIHTHSPGNSLLADASQVLLHQ